MIYVSFKKLIFQTGSNQIFNYLKIQNFFELPN